MLSWVNVMPGETRGCIGCHEYRTETSSFKITNLKAMQHLPAKIEPIKNIPNIIDYPRDIQPLWDKHCISCHSNEKHKGRVILTSDNNAKYYQSYVYLNNKNQYDGGGFFAPNGKEEYGNKLPYIFGSGGAELLNKLEKTHHNVNMSENEKLLIRRWIDVATPYAGTYSMLMEHVISFVSKNMYVTSTRKKEYKNDPLNKIWQKRCISCHKYEFTKLGNKSVKKAPSPHTSYAGHKYQTAFLPFFNLSYPEKSVLLNVTLAKEAGGWANPNKNTGKSKNIWDNHPIVFKSKDDPDYKNLLNLIIDAKKRLKESGRFDIPGYKPPEGYIYLMKKYGVLPQDYKNDGTLSPYEIDDKYFKSFENK